MGKVIRFPFHLTDQSEGIPYRCLMTMRLLFDRFRAGKIKPQQMFIVYGTRDATGPTWSYLNLGFEPVELRAAVDQVLEHIKESPEEDEHPDKPL